MGRVRYLIALVGLIAIAGCSDIGQPFNTPNAEPVCIAIGGLNARVNDFRALDPATADSTDYQTAAYGIQGAWATLESQVRIYGDAEADNLANTADELQRAAQQLPPGTSASDAATQLSDEIDAFQAALETVRSKIDCPPFPTPDPGS